MSKEQAFVHYANTGTTPQIYNTSPHAPHRHIWKYDYLVKCKCLKKNLETKGGKTYSNYQCKIDE